MYLNVIFVVFDINQLKLKDKKNRNRKPEQLQNSNPGLALSSFENPGPGVESVWQSANVACFENGDCELLLAF